MTPKDAIEYNLEVLGEAGIGAMVKELEESVRSGADLKHGKLHRIVEIRMDEKGQPSIFRAILDDGAYLRRVEIPRKHMLQHFRRELIDYYESLLCFTS